MGESPILAELEIVEGGKGVQVEFAKIGDMISHTIFLVNGEQKLPVLSAKVNASNLPCFTELHQQGDILFLTGANGPCHWSMSVESRQTVEGRDLLFDVACRIKEPSLKLSTEYSVHRQGTLRVDPFDGGTTIEAVGGFGVRILASSEVPTRVPATVRWKYGVLIH